MKDENTFLQLWSPPLTHLLWSVVSRKTKHGKENTGLSLRRDFWSVVCVSLKFQTKSIRKPMTQSFFFSTQRTLFSFVFKNDFWRIPNPIFCLFSRFPAFVDCTASISILHFKQTHCIRRDWIRKQQHNAHKIVERIQTVVETLLESDSWKRDSSRVIIRRLISHNTAVAIPILIYHQSLHYARSFVTLASLCCDKNQHSKPHNSCNGDELCRYEPAALALITESPNTFDLDLEWPPRAAGRGQRFFPLSASLQNENHETRAVKIELTGVPVIVS